MSANQNKKSLKQKLNENELISNFLNKKQKDEFCEPSSKKSKPNEGIADDSLKFFKNIEQKAKNVEPSTSKSNTVNDFINKPSTSKKSQTKKVPAKKTTTRKTKSQKPQTDIRKALSKHDNLVYHAISDSCVHDGLDPFEMQMALAISESLKDLNRKTDESEVKEPENPLSTGKVQSIHTVLERYGFKSKKTYSEYEIEMMLSKKSTKRSKYKKVPTLLTNTSDERKNEIIKLKIDEILNSDLFKSPETAEDQRLKPPIIYNMEMLGMHEDYKTTFRRISADNMNLEDFYVTELFEPSNVKAGHLLKDWSQIVGRDLSPEKKSTENEVKSMNSSCSDIFDGVESFSLEDTVDLRNVTDQLDFLHEKMSQSVVASQIAEKSGKEVNIDLTADTSDDATVDYSYSDPERVLMKIPDAEGVKLEEDFQQIECVDLTQVSDGPKLEPTTSSAVFNRSQPEFHSQTDENVGQYSANEDLNLSKESESQNFNSQSQKTTNDVYDLTQCDNLYTASDISSKNTFDENEIINISDEEVNYSINRFKSGYNESQSEDSYDAMEVDNLVEKSLIELATKDENVMIDQSVSELLNNFTVDSKCPRKTRSVMFFENENINDDSIADIMRKYGVVTSPPVAKRSFMKIQSESNLEGAADKSAESFNTEELENDFCAENSSQENISPQINETINQSLANILNSPMIRQNSAPKTVLARKSLGFDVNEKYIIDTENVFLEPDYSSMTPHELKLELFKYGIRPLPVKKAVELLTHIYNQTHPKIRVAIDEEIDMNDSRRALNVTDIVSNINMNDDYVFQLDSAGILEDEEYILPKIKKSKVPTCSIPLHISFYNMIRSNSKLQNYILEFRPLDLDQIYKHFRKFDLTYQLNDIIAFLDKRCITFKTKEQSYSKKHEKKKQKRSQKTI